MAFRLPLIPGGPAGTSISAELDIKFTRLDSDGTRNPFTLTNPSAFIGNLAEIKNYVQNSTLTLSTGFGQRVDVVVEQSDGKILIGGLFSQSDIPGGWRNRLVRLNSDGTEDTAFTTNLGTGFNDSVLTIAVQSDGKILVGGGFTSLNATTRNYLVRLNADGTVDTTFYTNLGTGFNSLVTALAIQSDGKILVGGFFTSLNATTRNYMVRLNADGTVDTTFYTNLGTNAFNNAILAFGIQSDAKIIVGGQFTSLGGTTRNRMVRLNTNGTVDTTFYTNLGTNAFNAAIRTLSIQSDDKIIAGGDFTSLGGTTRNYMVRLNAGGTVDTAFYTNLGTGFNSVLYFSAVQSDGKILVGGFFTSLNGTTRNRLVRLNADGTVDTAFYTNLGANGINAAIFGGAIQSNGKILISGQFS
jgi:uncharacterized delta-60 repeat protein